MPSLRRLLARLTVPRRIRCPLCGEAAGSQLPDHLTYAHTPAEIQQYVEATR